MSVYIDGFNLYHAIAKLNKNHLKWINLWRLSETFLRDGEVLKSVNFYTAILKWNADKQRRHEIFVAAQAAVGVKVWEANFKKSEKYCKEHDRYCNFYEEKKTDVTIALSIMADAFKRRFDRAVLVTADTDQIPTAEFMAAYFPTRKLTLFAPPGRLQEARDLGRLIPDRHEITEGRLGNCRLPRDVCDKNGRKAATMPAVYGRPGD